MNRRGLKTEPQGLPTFGVDGDEEAAVESKQDASEVGEIKRVVISWNWVKQALEGRGNER